MKEVGNGKTALAFLLHSPPACVLSFWKYERTTRPVRQRDHSQKH